MLVSKLISSGVTFNALATFSWMVEIAVLSFLLPNFTLPDNGWVCTFSGDIPKDWKHSDISYRYLTDLVQCCVFPLYS